MEINTDQTKKDLLKHIEDYGPLVDSHDFRLGHVAGQQYLLAKIKELESDKEELQDMLRTLTQEL
jgi:hypothetical protein